MVNALKWLVMFLETRFPAKVQPVSQAEFLNRVDTQSAILQIHEKKIDEMQKHIETLNLRVGLSRSTQATFGRKLNG